MTIKSDPPKSLESQFAKQMFCKSADDHCNYLSPVIYSRMQIVNCINLLVAWRSTCKLHEFTFFQAMDLILIWKSFVFFRQQSRTTCKHGSELPSVGIISLCPFYHCFSVSLCPCVTDIVSLWHCVTDIVSLWHCVTDIVSLTLCHCDIVLLTLCHCDIVSLTLCLFYHCFFRHSWDGRHLSPPHHRHNFRQKQVRKNCLDKDEGNCVQFFEIGIGKNMCVALCVIGWISYGLQVATHQYTAHCAQCTWHLVKFPKPTFNSVGEPDYTSHCTVNQLCIAHSQTFIVEHCRLVV